MLKTFVLGVALLVPFAAGAQTAPASGAATDKAAETYDEVERGLFIGVMAGPSFILNAPAPAEGLRPFAPGQSGGLEVGFDLGELLSISAFLTVSAHRAGSDYKGYSEAGAYSGDFSAIIPGGALKVNALGLQDAQGTRRTFIYLRAGAGYSLFSPRQLLPTPDILVFGGAGVEYYTRLRHFSIGAELLGTYLVGSGAIGFSVTPTLRYAF